MTLADSDQHASPRSLRWCELLLLLAVAFASPAVGSVGALIGDPSPWKGLPPNLVLVNMLEYELCALALLGYILCRQRRSVIDIGFVPAWPDLLRTLPLLVVTRLAFALAYYPVKGLSARAGLQGLAYLGSFRAASLGLVLAVVIVNPFYEELIVRAYTITEIKCLTGKTWLAVGVSVLVQALYHLYQGVSADLANCAAFLVLSLYFARTGRIGPVILTHLASDLVGVAGLRMRS